MALDPQKSITQYNHDIWQIENGLPQNTVTSIVQTQDDYIWFGTQDGVVRFDGVRFTVFNQKNTEAIKNNYVTALFEDREGNLWVGTNGGGLNRIKDEKFTLYSAQDGLSSDYVRAIYEDREGNLWIGSEGGLNRLKDGKFVSYKTKDGLSNNLVRSICEDREGNLWIGTYGGGLNRLKDGKFTVFATKEGLSNDNVLKVYEDREGSLWIGTDGGGLNRFKDGKFTAYTIADGLSSDIVKSIYEDREGSLWIGTEDAGLNRFRDGKFTAYTTKDGLSSDNVFSIREDREGSLWVGTHAGGLNRFREGKFSTYTTKEGLAGDVVRSIYEDRDGSLWIGSASSGLSRLKDGIFTTFTTKDGLSNNRVRALYGDRDGNLWISMDGGGLDRFKDGKFTAFTTKDRLSDATGRVIYEDREGTIWIGTDNGGLQRFKDGKFTIYTSKDGLAGDFARAIHEDREGNLWIGTRGGLCRFKDGKFTTYTTKDGLSHGNVFSIHEDREGVLWIGTSGGFNRLKDGKFTPYTNKDGLFDELVFQILEDENENLWLSSNRGVFRISKKELNDFAEGRSKSISFVPYGTSDGMKNSECNGAAQPAGWKTKDGRLWFPTIKGVVVIDPDNIKLNQLPPKVFIEEINADNRRIDLTDLNGLSPGNKKLEIHYTGLSFLAPEKVKFKYKLEGFDHEWVDAENRRVAYYTNLPPGSYRFRVMASNNDGVWNETGTEVSFHLNAFFYQTYWFYALSIFGIALLGFGAVKWRLNILKRSNEKLERRVEERTAELSEAQRIAHIGSWEWDIANNKISWSDEQFRIFGLEPQQFKPTFKTYRTIIHPDDKEFTLGIIYKSMRENVFPSFEHRILYPDGTVRVVHMNGKGDLDKKGNLLRMVGITQDITDRKRAETERQVISEIIQGVSLTSNLDELLGLIHQSIKKVLYAENCFVALFDKKTELLNMQFFVDKHDMVPPPFKLGKQMTASVFRQGRPMLINEEVIQRLTAEGEIELLGTAPANWLGVPLRTPSEIIGVLVVQHYEDGQAYNQRDVELLTSVGDQIALAIERKRADDELKQSKEWLAAMFEASQDGIIVEESEKIVFVNNRHLKMYGYDNPEEIIGTHISELLTPEDGERMLEYSRKRSCGEEVPTIYEFKGLDNGKGKRDFEASISTFTSNGKFYIVTAQKDITERKQNEEQLKVFNQKLQQSNRELQDFAYVASHDLQEPLRKVQAFADRLSSKYADALSGSGIDYLERMRNAAERMQTLIQDLLTFSRVTTKAKPFVSVDLEKVTREVLSDLEVRIEQTSATIEIDDLPEIDADPTQMRQLMQNLIGNALKFHRKDTAPIIKISAQASKNQLNSNGNGRLCEVTVEDNGIGFDEKYLDRIFTVFQRLHGRTDYEGSGVGLAICRKIAERHHGTITAESSPDKGSTFIITLPFKQVNEELN